MGFGRRKLEVDGLPLGRMEEPGLCLGYVDFNGSKRNRGESSCYRLDVVEARRICGLEGLEERKRERERERILLGGACEGIHKFFSQMRVLLWNEEVEAEEKLFTALLLLEEAFVKCNKTKTPRLIEWAECFCSVEAVKKVLPEAEKLEGYRKSIKAASAAAAAPSS
ncbi:glutathione S-transferase [Dendrobium catenatum]|uniref:Glutathione S-transferase n=1 Tax=Dendrobium catenatum TaxID=906689 RepID=A0A2I0WB98_9ASPA|nr:glutathione S-transferase [Dendrobium catenatum]